MLTRPTYLLAALALVSTGCPHKEAPKQDDAAVAVVDAAPASTEKKIANSADVKRYPDDESTLSGDAPIKSGPAKAMKSVPKGDLVASLPAGTTVTQLAEHNGFYLVKFDDPKDASQQLEGWVVKFAFQAPPTKRAAADAGKPGDAGKLATKPTAPACPAGATYVFAGDDTNGPSCHKSCSDDSECPKGFTCEAANIVDDDGNPIPHAVTVVCTKASAPTPPPAKPDAGAAKGLQVPAGNPPEIPNPSGLPCPAGYGNAGGLLSSCNKACKAAADCAKPYRCDSVGGDAAKNCIK